MAASPAAPTHYPQPDCKAFLHTRIPPLDKQIVLCFMGRLSPAAVPPPHLPTPQLYRPCIPCLQIISTQSQKVGHKHPFFFWVPITQACQDKENIPVRIPQTTGPFSQQLKLTLYKLCPIRGRRGQLSLFHSSKCTSLPGAVTSHNLRGTASEHPHRLKARL